MTCTVIWTSWKVVLLPCMREKAALQCILKSLSSMKNCKRAVSLRISANAELYTTLKCLSIR